MPPKPARLGIFLIHLIALIFSFVSGRRTGKVDFAGIQPDGGYPLWVVYVVWISVIIILNFPFKWYARYKASHPENKWLGYL
ncbi:MAG: hypothetical protein ABI863_15825 [Ginsengibacter sp.]